jgi:hypothetical protein
VLFATPTELSLDSCDTSIATTLNEIHHPVTSGCNRRLYRLAGAGWVREANIRPFILKGDLEFEAPWIRAGAMARYLGRVIASIRKRRKSGRGGADRGGKENVFRSTHGHEKLSLARECANLFDKYGLRQRVTSTETGKFFEFVSHVYDFAVGQKACGDSRGLADPIKKIVREYKKTMALADKVTVTRRR